MTDGIESRHLRAAMAWADAAKRTPELNRLLNAGDMLANCAFNLAQRDTVLDAPLRKTLDLCRREWDSARADLAKAAPISPIAGAAGSTDKGCDPADERAAFEADKHDAARLDWLQSKGVITIETVVGMSMDDERVEISDGMFEPIGVGLTLREAIDAAMVGQPAPTGEAP